MKQAVKEWIEKAEGDFQTAGRELKAKPRPNYDAVCFHAQQCAEKYLKAVLIQIDVEFPRTHDLVMLLNLALDYESLLGDLKSELGNLTAIGVEVRYPGMCADLDDATAALRAAEKLRAIIRPKLAL